jgi:predicted metal-dependent phosphoesterase TrpH
MSDELKVLRRIEGLMQSLVKISLAEPMSRLLSDDTLRGLYEKTGKLKREQLEKETGFSAGKISGLWSQWEEAGLLVKEGKTFRKPFEIPDDD